MSAIAVIIFFLLVLALIACYGLIVYLIVKEQLDNPRCRECPHSEDCAMAIMSGLPKLCDQTTRLDKNQLTPQI